MDGVGGCHVLVVAEVQDGDERESPVLAEVERGVMGK